VRHVADFRRFEEIQIPVPGGELAVLRWPAESADAPVAVAAHGITANALAWASLAEALDGRVTLLAPDLRGRAYSRDIAGPFGIGADAADVVAALDHAGVRTAVAVGHSMGGFVAGVAAARHPGRFEAVVAVDGGVPFALPARFDPDRLLEEMIGPAIRKLSMRFPDGEAYLDFHRGHPSFVGNWSPQLTAYLARDTLWLEDGTVMSSCREEVIRADGRQILLDPESSGALKTLSCPIAFIYAERGILNEPQALYDEERLAAAGVDHLDITRTLIPDTNHYTVTGPGAGADAVAAAILRLAGLDAEPERGATPLPDPV
jgi:pimeloyl-ACP methyl ester carboxylesterase